MILTFLFKTITLCMYLCNSPELLPVAGRGSGITGKVHALYMRPKEF